MKSLIAALSLFIPLVSASVPQDVLGIINVNSTCGEIRATSMSWPISATGPWPSSFCSQKKLLHFQVPMVISTGSTVASKLNMDGNRPSFAWKTSSPVHSQALLQRPIALLKHALNIFGSLRNMVVNTTSPRSSWPPLLCKKAHVSLMLLAAVANKVWCRSPVTNVSALQFRVAAENLCAVSSYCAIYGDAHATLRNSISIPLPDISPIH